jgi:hypothetical protein
MLRVTFFMSGMCVDGVGDAGFRIERRAAPVSAAVRAGYQDRAFLPSASGTSGGV